MTRAKALSGLSLGTLASQHQIELPQNLQRSKGWVGQFLESLLGATAASKSEPDFEHLGIELKTLPIDARGLPQESTFVSTISLLTVGQLTWKTSTVYKKLKHVLWIPIRVDDKNNVSERRVGMPHLWQPSEEDELILKQDWQELTDMISLGQLEQITARHGQYLQVRPKGANAKSLRWGISHSGEKVLTLPRGFYLRPSFTRKLLKEHFLFSP